MRMTMITATKTVRPWKADNYLSLTMDEYEDEYEDECEDDFEDEYMRMTTI